MDVKSILDMKGDTVLTVPPDLAVIDAAAILRDNYIGAVVVVGPDGGIVGILSERDVAVALPEHGVNIVGIAVREIMTEDVITCAADATLQQVLDIMTTNGIRHLPIVDGDRLVGLISIRDVVNNWLGALPDAGADVRRNDAA